MELFLLLLFIFTFIVYEVHIWVEAEHAVVDRGVCPSSVLALAVVGFRVSDFVFPFEETIPASL